MAGNGKIVPLGKKAVEVVERLVRVAGEMLSGKHDVKRYEVNPKISCFVFKDVGSRIGYEYHSASVLLS